MHIQIWLRFLISVTIWVLFILFYIWLNTNNREDICIKRLIVFYVFQVCSVWTSNCDYHTLLFVSIYVTWRCYELHLYLALCAKIGWLWIDNIVYCFNYDFLWIKPTQLLLIFITGQLHSLFSFFIYDIKKIKYRS